MISHHFTVSSSGKQSPLAVNAEGFLLGDESSAQPVPWSQVTGYSKVDTSGAQLHLEQDQLLVVAFRSADERERFTTLLGRCQVKESPSVAAATPVPIASSAPKAPLRFSAGTQNTDRPADRSMDQQSDGVTPATRSDAAAGTAKGKVMLVGAVVVFVICSIVQAAGNSSMFSTSYFESDSAFLGLLVNLTFWPGWLLTAALVIGGIKELADRD